MTGGRHLDWDGCFNARDLGGLRTKTGREIRWGAAVRADALDQLSALGWAAVDAHGIGTIIDLRNADERKPDAETRPARITTVHLPLDDIEDREFWTYWSSGWQFGTPLYYQPHLVRFPKRSAAVVAAIAHAGPGGVVFHCGIGRDRTGLVTMLLLSLLGVGAQDIAADYALSSDRLRPRFAHRGERDQGPAIDEFLASQGTSAGAVIEQTLRRFDREVWLREGGLRQTDLATLQARLLR
jgi:protein-tyrosine phosphatase